MKNSERLKHYLSNKKLTAEQRGERWAVINAKEEVVGTGAIWSLAVMKAIMLDPDYCVPH